MSTSTSRAAYLFAGPTATGKSAIAHRMAREYGWAVLSADAMLVYVGMDVGTAKPSPEERVGLRYGGIDCVTPDQPFHVGAYLEYARSFLRSVPEDQPVVMVGGTGLYFKALLLGLDPMPETDPAVRARVQHLYEDGGLSALTALCRDMDPERWATVADPANPRRVMRALELALMGVPVAHVWKQQPMNTSGVVVDRERADLDERISRRVEQMYARGLLDEVARLRERYPHWSHTAQKAIGYKEAAAVLAGTSTVEEAQQATMTRTRRYARRQRTWFRHQLPFTAFPIGVSDSESSVGAALLAHWRKHGPCTISCG